MKNSGKKYLIVSATHKEIEPLAGDTAKDFFSLSDSADVLVTGVGILPTVYALTKILAQNRYELVLNVGIAGSFGTFKHLQTVEVTAEAFATYGKIADGNFKSMFEAGLWDKNSFPFENGIITNKKHFPDLPSANGVTTSIVGFGAVKTENYKPDIETMEGAAFFYVCKSENFNFAAIRTISNYVNDSNWVTADAIRQLNDFIKTNLEL